MSLMFARGTAFSSFVCPFKATGFYECVDITSSNIIILDFTTEGIKNMSIKSLHVLEKKKLSFRLVSLLRQGCFKMTQICFCFALYLMKKIPEIAIYGN